VAAADFTIGQQDFGNGGQTGGSANDARTGASPFLSAGEERHAWKIQELRRNAVHFAAGVIIGAAFDSIVDSAPRLAGFRKWAVDPCHGFGKKAGGKGLGFLRSGISDSRSDGPAGRVAHRTALKKQTACAAQCADRAAHNAGNPPVNHRLLGKLKESPARGWPKGGACNVGCGLCGSPRCIVEPELGVRHRVKRRSRQRDDITVAPTAAVAHVCWKRSYRVAPMSH
jgi:hypothetical protein